MYGIKWQIDSAFAVLPRREDQKVTLTKMAPVYSQKQNYSCGKAASQWPQYHNAEYRYSAGMNGYFTSLTVEGSLFRLTRSGFRQTFRP